ncbi:hypothetical protein BTA51_21020 [Hahella sp. CCB-MM4]|uniref:imelysin family protein n=1 Tax=Hahella sp. (strain CCB-MM4) TaxID=1926491 RepID=UPI000B9BFC79|nr:imelysin family protein [Hahella sp. CCB-MM4]OZG71420.1 hypothetical protein BTA51_21020 [Hahella sp. CCB-MM4]
MPLRAFLVVLSLSVLATACSDRKDAQVPSKPSGQKPEVESTGVPASEPSPEKQEKLSRVSTLSEQLHQQALNDAVALHASTTNLRKNHSFETLQKSRELWLASHRSLQALWSLYVLDSPAELLKQHPNNSSFQYRSILDQTPLLPGYLDTVEGYPASGLVHALDLPISHALLEEKHLFADPLFLTYGMHPLEFMLWSKSGLSADLNSDAPQPATTASEDAMQVMQRRLELVDTLSTDLVSYLTQLKALWHQKSPLNAFLPSDTPTKRNEQHPQLEQVMRIIDRLILAELTPLEGEPGWHYQEHMVYAEDSAHFWQGRVDGLTSSLTLWKNNTAPVEQEVSELRECLIALSPTDTKQQEQIQSCEALALSLREKLIIRFSEISS